MSRKSTDFFQKELPNTEQQVMPMFLRRYQPTSVLRRKGPVGRPRRQSQPDAVIESPPESSHGSHIQLFSPAEQKT